MAELKTKPTKNSVAKFLASIPDPQRRADCERVAKMMTNVTKLEPTMWGTSMVGYGEYQYEGKSGRKGTWFMVGFSPRKNTISIHLMCGLAHVGDLLGKLGKYKTGVGCLTINKLSDIDFAVLTKMVNVAWTKLNKS